tara:strand:+ start:143 stop:655 length:513 start_codon:yes stop_codon:yes gene_type:complete
MKKSLLLALIFLGITYTNAQSLSINEAFDVLTKWEGQWKNSAVFEESVWIRESVKTRGRTSSSLILSNNYLEIMVNNVDNTSKHIICYDQNLKKFNKWEFKNDGTNTFWIGEWSKNDKTMTWDFIDFSGNGILGQIIEKFESEAIIYSEIIMKDKDGNILLKINSTKKKI